jgi:hypothetical protein
VTALTVFVYLLGVITLLATKSIVIPIVSFVLLFILLYFFAIDWRHFSKVKLFSALGIITILEILIFALGKTWHSYLEIVLLNLAIGLLLFQLFYYLRTRLVFKAFAYFTEGRYTVTVLITLFVSVLMVGKYAQIPFSCEDINSFFPRFFSFSQPKTPVKEVPIVPVEKTEVELFFERVRTNITAEAMELQESMSKNSCEFVMAQLRKIQINQTFQMAVLVLLYFLLIGVSQIVLWIINFISFFLFFSLKPFKVYRYEKKMVEKERIV